LDDFENLRKGISAGKRITVFANELQHSDDDREQLGIDCLSTPNKENEFKSALLLAIQCCYAISGLSPNSLFQLYLRGSRFTIWKLESLLRSPYERITLRTALNCAVAQGTSSVMWLSLSGGHAGAPNFLLVHASPAVANVTAAMASLADRFASTY
jgi:hypothetical protein